MNMYEVREGMWNQIFLYTIEKNELGPPFWRTIYFSRYQNVNAHTLLTQQVHSRDLFHRKSQNCIKIIAQRYLLLMAKMETM